MNLGQPGAVVDIELTNRCNASCTFCPRSSTPHQGVMTPDTLAKALERTLELDACPFPALKVRAVSFCGLGDQLLNADVANYVRSVRDAGLDAAVNTNAALLDDVRGNALLDAGVTWVFVNAGEVGDDYERVYGLPFEKVRRNVARFAEQARGRCALTVVLVDHAEDPEHVHEVERFWRAQGVARFLRLDLLNRGGTLEIEDMDFEAAPQHAEARARLDATGSTHGCLGPFAFPFIGYDGRYYLCSSDWKKEASVGDVFEHSMLEIIARKGELVRSRDLVCHGCNHDAVNRMTALLVQRDAGRADHDDVHRLTAELTHEAAGIDSLVAYVRAYLAPHGGGAAAAGGRPTRRPLIPVSSSDTSCGHSHGP